MSEAKKAMEALRKKYGTPSGFVNKDEDDRSTQTQATQPASGVETKSEAKAAMERLRAKYEANPKAWTPTATAPQTTPTAQSKMSYLDSARNATQANISTGTGTLSDIDRESRRKELQAELDDLNSQASFNRKKMVGYQRGNVGNLLKEAERESVEIANRISEVNKQLEWLDKPESISYSDQLSDELAAAQERQRQAQSAVSKYSGEAGGRALAALSKEEREALYQELNEANSAASALSREQDQIGYLNDYQDKVYDDTFTGQFGANYRQGRIAQDTNAAFAEYIANPTEANRNYAYALQELEEQFRTNNQSALDDEGVVASWITKTAAGYIPQATDNLKTKAAGAVIGGVTGLLVGQPIKGAGAGITVASGIQSYNQMKGAAYRALIAEGMDEASALEAAQDEAFISALLEMGDTAFTLLTLGSGKAASILGNAAIKSGSKNAVIKGIAGIFGKGAANKAAKDAAKWAGMNLGQKAMRVGGGVLLNAGQEYVEEWSQEMVSSANKERDGTGKWDLVKESAGLSKDALTGENPDALARAHEAGTEGFKIGLMFGGLKGGFNAAVSTWANAKTTAQQEQIVDEVMQDRELVESLIDGSMEMGAGTVSEKLAIEMRDKLAANDGVTRQDVAQLLAANEAYVRAGGMDNVDQSIEQAAREAVGLETGDASAPQDVLDVLERDDTQPHPEEVALKTAQNTKQSVPYNVMSKDNPVRQAHLSLEKMAGYGENGTKTFASIVESSNADPSKVRMEFQSAYEAGLTNLPRERASLLSGVQEEAYNAGRMDYIMQMGKYKDKRFRISKEAGFERTNLPADVTERQWSAVNMLAKAAGVKVRIATGLKGNAEIAEDGTVLIDRDFQREVKGKKRSIVFYAAHEIGMHRLMQLAPEEGRAFINAVVQDANAGLAYGQTTVTEKRQAAYARQNVNLTTSKAMEEVAADSILDLYDSEEDFIAAINRIINGKDEQAKRGARKFKDILDDIVKKLKNVIAKLTGKEKVEAQQTLSEVEQLRTLYEKALQAATDKVKARAVDGVETGTSTMSADDYIEMHDLQYNLKAVKSHKESIKKNYSAADATVSLDALLSRYAKIVDIWERIGGELNSKFLEDWNNKTDRVFTIFKAQSGYKYNVELSSMCKKGVPLFEAIDTIVREEVMRELNVNVLGKAEKEILYDILKRHNFEVPCAICYVEQARQREGIIIDAFLNGSTEDGNNKIGWNTVLGDIETEMQANGVSYKFQNVSRSIATEKYTPADIAMDDKTLAAFHDAVQKLANDEIRRYNKENGKSRKLLKEVTPEGVKACFSGTLPSNLKIFKTLLTEPSSRFRIGKDLLYSSMTTMNLAALHNGLYGLFNAQGGVSGYKTKQGTTVYWGEILGKRWRPETVRKEGGIRQQSNSDAQMYTVLDKAQMYIDHTAKGFYVQEYSKVLSELKLFGLSGAKINASLIPKVVEYKNADGSVDLERTRLNAGLDEAGNPIYDDFEGINHNEAFMLLEDPNYSKNVCGICIGYSDNHILKLLDDSRVQMIIGFHDKTNDPDKRYRGARYAKNYNGLNEAVADNGAGKTVHIGFNPYIHKAERRFTHNASTKRFEGTTTFGGKQYVANDIPRLAADMYLADCAKNGYRPAYEDFAWHRNYYKLLSDIGLYDSNGQYAPHEKVAYRMPDNVPYLDKSGNKRFMATDEYIKVELQKELEIRDAVAAALADTSSDGIIPQFKAAIMERSEKSVNNTGRAEDGRGTISYSMKGNYESPIYETLETRKPIKATDFKADKIRRAEAAERYGLDKTEASRLGNYVGGYLCYKLNANMLNDQMTDGEKGIVASIESALRKFPEYSGRAYRNLQFKTEAQYNAFLNEYAESETVSLKAFTSVSKLPNGYPLFGNGVIHMVVDCETGRDIADTYGLIRQQEVILLPGTELKVTKVTTANDGNPLIFAQEVAASAGIRENNERNSGDYRSSQGVHRTGDEQGRASGRWGEDSGSVYGEVRRGRVRDGVLSERGESAETGYVLVSDKQFSLKEHNDLLRENARLKEVNEGLRDQFKITEFAKVDRKSLDSFTKRLLKDYSSGADINETRDALDGLYTYLANGEDGMSPSWNEAYKRAYETAVGILEASSTLDDEMYRQYKELRDRLRTTRISISPEHGSDLMGYENLQDFRRRNMGRLNITKDGLPVDVAYAELALLYPELFDEYTHSTQGDQLVHIADVLESMQPMEINPYSLNMRENATWLANDIMERFFELPQAKPTFADKAQRKLTNQAIKDAKKLERVREQKNERIRELIAGNREKVKQVQAKERDKRLKAVRDIKEHYKVKEGKASESRKARDLRARVVRHAEQMSKKLLRGTDKSNVPEALKGAVAELLAAINMESNYTYDPATGGYRKSDDGLPTRRTEEFRKVREQYEAIAKNNEYGMVLDPNLLGVPTEGIPSMLDQVIAMKDIRLADMNLSQLQVVYDVLRVMEHSIQMAGKMLTRTRWESIHEAAENFMEDTATRRTKRALTKDHKMLDIETPYTFFSHFGNAGKDFFRMLRNAQDAEEQMQDQLRDRLAESVSLEDRQAAEKETVTYTTQRGDDLTLSKAHIMNIYLLNKRKQAQQHLLSGGIVQPEIGKVRKGTDAVLLNELDVANIISKLSDKEREMADALQKLTLLMAEWGNKASMTVYGIKKFNDPDYWTIHSSDIGINQTVEQGQNKARSIANMGSAKAVIPEARNTLDIDSAFEVFDRHASDMMCYSAWLAPMEDANRLFNYKYRDADWNPTGKTMKGIIDRVSGEGSTQYWLRLMEDIQNGLSAPADTASEQGVMKAIGNVKKAAVSANLRVVIQQPTAYARAAVVLDPDIMLAALGKNAALKPAVDGWNNAVKYAPIAARKAAGGYEVAANPKQLAELLYQPKSKKGKVAKGWREAPLWLAGKMDQYTWGTIWNACEMQVARDNKTLKKDSDAFNDAVKELFTDVIDQTQVVDGVLQRSQAMRSGSNFMKQMTSFTGEPTQGANMVIRAYDQLRYEQNPKKRGRAIKTLSRAVSAYMFVSVLNAFAQSLIDGLRDDDEDKEYWEKVWTAFSGINGNEETWKDFARNILLASNVVNNMNPATWLPVWKDVLSIIQGYSVERMDAASLSDFFDSLTNVVKSVDGNGKYTPGYAALKSLTLGHKLLGGSSYNTLRDIESIVRTVQVETDNYLARYETMKLMTNPENNLSEYVGLLFKAYQNDQQAYKTMYDDLVASGVDPEKIRSKMESLMKKAQGVKKVDDLEQRYLSPTQQKEYSSALSSMKSNRVWKNASAAQRDDVEGMLYDLTVKNAAGEKLQEKIDGGARYGLDETEYLLYKLALDVCDQPSESGKLGSYTNDEVEAAIRMLGLSAKESAYLWDAQGKSEKSNPWRK